MLKFLKEMFAFWFEDVFYKYNCFHVVPPTHMTENTDIVKNSTCRNHICWFWQVWWRFESCPCFRKTPDRNLPLWNTQKCDLASGFAQKRERIYISLNFRLHLDLRFYISGKSFGLNYNLTSLRVYKSMEAITSQNSEWHLPSAFRGRRSPARMKPPRTVSQGSGLMVQTSSPNQLQWEMLHQTRFRLNGTEIANQKWLLPLSGVSSCNRTSLPPWKWREGATAVQVSRWVVVSYTNFPDSELFSVSNQGGVPHDPAVADILRCS